MPKGSNMVWFVVGIVVGYMFFELFYYYETVFRLKELMIR